jgi:hypothetical protein
MMWQIELPELFARRELADPVDGVFIGKLVGIRWWALEIRESPGCLEFVGGSNEAQDVVELEHEGAIVEN